VETAIREGKDRDSGGAKKREGESESEIQKCRQVLQRRKGCDSSRQGVKRGEEQEQVRIA
jgi:hypothetical protein